MGYATWIKDGYEKLIQKSCRSQESCQEESEPGQAQKDRHVPLHEPRSCGIQVSEVLHSIL